MNIIDDSRSVKFAPCYQKLGSRVIDFAETPSGQEGTRKWEEAELQPSAQSMSTACFQLPKTVLPTGYIRSNGPRGVRTFALQNLGEKHSPANEKP